MGVTTVLTVQAVLPTQVLAGEMVRSTAKVRHVASSPLSSTPTTIPAAVIHDAAYGARYLAQVPDDQRVLLTVLISVVNQTYSQNPRSSQSKVAAEVGALKSSLLGGRADLRGLGLTTQQQVAGATRVLLSSPGSAPVTSAARAVVARQLYQTYVAKAADGFGDDQDRFSGASVGAVAASNGVAVGAGSSFASTEQQALDRALTLTRSSSAVATLVDSMAQTYVKVSVRTTASSLASDPVAGAAFAALGVTIRADGSGLGDLATAAAASVGIVSDATTATAAAGGEITTLNALQRHLGDLTGDAAARQQSQEHAKRWIESQQATITAITAKADTAVKVLTFLGANSQEVKAVVTTVKAALTIYSSVLTIVDTVSKAGAIISGLINFTTAAAMGNVVGAVMSVIGLFSSSTPQSDPVFLATQQIQKQVEQLSKDMNVRFNRVDKALNGLFNQVQEGFATIDAQNRVVTADVTATMQQVAAVQWSINRISQQLTTYASDEIQRRIQGFIDAWIGYRNHYGRDMTPVEFSAAESALFTAATADSALSAVAGDLGLATSNESLANELAGYGPDKTRTYLNILARRFPGHAPNATSAMVTVSDWSRAADGYRQLLDENPVQALSVDPSRLTTILAKGTQVDTALRGLRTAPSGAPMVPVMSDVIDTADQALTDLQSSLQAAAATYLATALPGIDVWAGNEQNVPDSSLRPLTNCQALTPTLDDVATQRASFPPALLALHGIQPNTPMRACMTQGSTYARSVCRVVRGVSICKEYADYWRTLTLQWMPGTDWTTVRSINRDYGQHLQCSDDISGDTNCVPDSVWIPGWSDTTKADIIAGGARSDDLAQLDALRQRSTAVLTQTKAAMFADLAAKVRSGALRVANGPYTGQDAARSLSGAVMLLRATTTLVSPTAVTGDEVVRAILFGFAATSPAVVAEQLPSNDAPDGTTTGVLWQRLTALAAAPPNSSNTGWSDWLGNGHNSLRRLGSLVQGHVNTDKDAGLSDTPAAIGDTISRSLAGDAVQRQASWSMKGGPVALGSVKLGSSASTTLTLLNTSAARPLTWTVPRLSGPAARDWAVRSTCPATLSPGASCTAVVTVTPTAVGIRAATLTLGLTPAGIGPTSVPLTATGTAHT